MLDPRIWAELLKAVLNLEFLKGYRTTLSILGFVGLILYSLFGEVANYEQAVTAILALLAILGLRAPTETQMEMNDDASSATA